MNLEALAAMDDCEHATGKTLDQHRKDLILGWNWDVSGWDKGRPIVHNVNMSVHSVNTDSVHDVNDNPKQL